MAVQNGKDGRVQISGASSYGNFTGSTGGSRAYMHTILNLTNWTLSQPGPDLIDATAMGDDWKKYKAAVRDGGSISISGFFDWEDTTGQKALINRLSSGTVIRYPGTPGTTEGTRFELWPGDDTTVAGAGCWKFSTGAGTTTLEKKLIINSVNVGQDKSGLGSIDMNLKITDGYFAYSTALSTTP